MGETLRRAALFGLAVIFLAVAISYSAVRDYSAHWQPMADIGATFEEGTLAILSIEPGGAAARGGLTKLDRLQAIQGERVSTLLEVHDRLRDVAPGEMVRLTVILAGLELPRTYEVVLAEREAAAAPSWLGTAGRGCVRVFPFLLLAGVGAVLLVRPGRLEAWLVALAAAGVVASAPLLAYAERIPPGLRGGMVAFQVMFAMTAPAFLLYLLSVFPERSTLDRRFPKLKEVWLVASVGLAMPFVMWSLLSNGEGFYGSAWPGVGLGIGVVSWLGALGIGLPSLWECARDGSSVDASRRAQFIGVGAAGALLPTLILKLVAVARGHAFAELPLWLLLPGVLALLLLPATLGYVIAARDVLSVPVLAKRCARFLIVERGVLAPIVLLSGVVALVLGDFVSRVTGLGGTIGAIAGAAAGAALVWAGRYGHRRVFVELDRLLFPKTFAARRALETLPEHLARAWDGEEIVGLLGREIERALQPSSLAVYLARDGETLKLERGEVHGGMEEIPLDESLPDPNEDEAGRESSRPAVAIRTLDHVAQLGPDCLVPIRGRASGLLGLLVVGARRSEEPYSEDARRLLADVGRHAGDALERAAGEPTRNS